MAPKGSGGAKGGGKAARPTSKPQGMTKSFQAAGPTSTRLGGGASGVARSAFGGRVGGGLARPAAGVSTHGAAKVFSAFGKPARPQSGKGQGKSQGNSHGKSHGKGKRQHAAPTHREEEENPGYKGERKRVGNGRVTGKVISWKGPFGWIVPDERVNHSGANKRGGKIYLDQIDVDQELSGVGCRVSFFVYCDNDGLGAQHVIPVKGGGPPVKQTIEKSKAKGAGKDSKAKGKGKGKGKDKKPEATGEKEERVGQPPDKSTRESLVEAGNGTIVDWRGEVGWLKPDEPLTHPDAKQFGRRKGCLFVHSSDCEGETPMTGAQVMYSMYKDTHGLGAEAVTVLVQGSGEKPKREPKEEAEGEDGEEGEANKKTKLKQALQKSSLLKTKVKGKGKGKDKGKGKGKGNKPAGEKGPSGPDLPRERVSDELITGVVDRWSGRIGWITPNEPIDHPDATLHNGKLYAHIKDLKTVLEEGTKMEKGMTVQCYVFKDSSGLGAEEIETA